MFFMNPNTAIFDAFGLLGFTRSNAPPAHRQPTLWLALNQTINRSSPPNQSFGLLRQFFNNTFGNDFSPQPCKCTLDTKHTQPKPTKIQSHLPHAGLFQQSPPVVWTSRLNLPIMSGFCQTWQSAFKNSRNIYVKHHFTKSPQR